MAPLWSSYGPKPCLVENRSPKRVVLSVPIQFLQILRHQIFDFDLLCVVQKLLNSPALFGFFKYLVRMTHIIWAIRYISNLFLWQAKTVTAFSYFSLSSYLSLLIAVLIFIQIGSLSRKLARGDREQSPENNSKIDAAERIEKN